MFLIIKNIFKIHAFFYIVMFVAFITGNIRDFLIFTSIIIVHELGHIVAGVVFSWDVKQVILLPFGGLTIFNNLINTSLFQEFIVALMGPLFQIIFYLILNNLFVLPDRVVYYNFVLLFFNLLPIFPLDGSKFLYVFLCLFFPFRYGHLIIIFVSFIFIFAFLFFLGRFDLLIFLILLFLFFKVYSELRNHRFIFNKFLLERYSYNFSFSHVKYINSVNKMYLWCRHLFLVDNNYVSEANFLKKLFDK